MHPKSEIYALKCWIKIIINKSIKIWATTQKMAQSMVLGRFGRLEDKFFTLIPKALAFKPISDIKEFVYTSRIDGISGQFIAGGSLF